MLAPDLGINESCDDVACRLLISATHIPDTFTASAHNTGLAATQCMRATADCAANVGVMQSLLWTSHCLPPLKIIAVFAKIVHCCYFEDAKPIKCVFFGVLTSLSSNSKILLSPISP